MLSIFQAAAIAREWHDKQARRIYEIRLKGSNIVIASCSSRWVERELEVWRRHYGEVEAHATALSV